MNKYIREMGLFVSFLAIISTFATLIFPISTIPAGLSTLGLCFSIGGYIYYYRG